MKKFNLIALSISGCALALGGALYLTGKVNSARQVNATDPYLLIEGTNHNTGESGEHWSFDYVDSVYTLTLTNFSTNSSVKFFGSNSDTDNFKIILNGENNITINHPGEYVNPAVASQTSKTMTIEGPGSLGITINGNPATALSPSNNLTINSGSIEINATSTMSAGGVNAQGDFNINDGSISIHSSHYGITVGKLNISENVDNFEIIGESGRAINLNMSTGSAVTELDLEGYETLDGEAVLLKAGNYAPSDFTNYKKVKIASDNPEDITPPAPVPSPTNGGLGIGAIIGIVAGGIILTCGIVYLLLFFLFNKWIEVDGKAIRVFRFFRKNGKTRVISFKCKVYEKGPDQVYNTKADALKNK